MTSSTVIDAPPSARMAVALYKNDVICYIISGIQRRRSCFEAIAKLSFMGAPLLDNHPPEDESQTHSVVRRLQQAADGDWRRLQVGATVPVARYCLSSHACDVNHVAP